MRVSSAAVHVSAGQGPGCDYRFFALLRNDSELDLALLYVKTASATCPCENTIGSFRYFDIVLPSPTLARNILGSNEALTLFLTKASPFSRRAALSPDEGRARQKDYSNSTAQNDDLRRTAISSQCLLIAGSLKRRFVNRELSSSSSRADCLLPHPAGRARAMRWP